MRLTAPITLWLAMTALAYVAVGPMDAVASENEDDESDSEEVEFSEDYLADDSVIAFGKDLWQETCRHCHGANAYPGKAPKLKPRKYEPDFVFDRVTNGFRKMPPWKDVLSLDERKALVAFIKSASFRP